MMTFRRCLSLFALSIVSGVALSLAVVFGLHGTEGGAS